MPALTALVVLFFIFTWNEFLLALVMLPDPQGLRTAPLALADFAGSQRGTVNLPLTAAAALIVAAAGGRCTSPATTLHQRPAGRCESRSRALRGAHQDRVHRRRIDPWRPARWPPSSSRRTNFAGSEIVLIDLDEERLELVRRLAEHMARSRGADLADLGHHRPARRRSRTSTRCSRATAPAGSRRACSTSASRSATASSARRRRGRAASSWRCARCTCCAGILDDLEDVAPKARIFNYTNPVNILAQAVTHPHGRRVRVVLRGPDHLHARRSRETAGLDPAGSTRRSPALNHNSWSVRAPVPRRGRHAAASARPGSAGATTRRSSRSAPRQLHLAALDGRDPVGVLHVLLLHRRDRRASCRPSRRRAPRTSWASVPDYWRHYEEQPDSDDPQLDPARSRGGIHELELAIDAMDAIFNDRGEVLPGERAERGARRARPRRGRRRRGAGPLRRRLDHAAAAAAAAAARARPGRDARRSTRCWRPRRRGAATAHDAIRALAANPLVRSVEKAERLYDELAEAHRAYLPERLLA